MSILSSQHLKQEGSHPTSQRLVKFIIPIFLKRHNFEDNGRKREGEGGRGGGLKREARGLSKKRQREGGEGRENIEAVRMRMRERKTE